MPRISGLERAPSTHFGAPRPSFPLNCVVLLINWKTQGASLGSNGKGDGVETTVANVFSEAGRQGGVKAVAPPGL